MATLARYIIRASYSQERFDWLASMASPIPELKDKMFRWDGFDNNVSQGIRQIENKEFLTPLFKELVTFNVYGHPMKEAYFDTVFRLENTIFEKDGSKMGTEKKRT